MGSIDLAVIMPHPPILVPEIGKKQLELAKQSSRALAELVKKIKGQQFDTVIVITPHGEVGQASVPIYTSHVFEGSFSMFGLPKPVLNFRGEPDLARQIIKSCDFASSCNTSLLDHGALVPLSFLKPVLNKATILPIAIAYMPLAKLFEFGQSLAKIIKVSDKKVLLVASADMSHRLASNSPNGYSPRGKEFDEQLVQLVKNHDVKGLLNFDQPLADEAGQDALWSIAMLLGSLDGLNVKHQVLSYEGPFGVGYMVAEFET